MTKQEQNYLKSIKLLPVQIKQAYQEAGKIKLSKSYNQINKIVACGMGGSQLGVDFVKHLFADKIKVPIIQVRGYELPKFIDGQTLIILISYSGDTEEVLTIMTNACPGFLASSKAGQGKMTKRVVITSGGKLATFAKKQKTPAYIFNPINNPSGQPRVGTGYIIGSLLSILKRLNLIDVEDKQITALFKSQKINHQPQIINLKNKIRHQICSL